MNASPPRSLRKFGRDDSGSAGIEFAIGGVAILTIAMLCFDLYSLVRVNGASARSAVAIARPPTWST